MLQQEVRRLELDDEGALDIKGVVYKGRTEGMNEYKAEFIADTQARTLEEALVGADVFLGCSAKGLMTQDMVRSMATDPIVFALANPDPEISYPDAKAARADVIMATGRSDYPNQVNNVLGFPFIFRGALDVQATTINEAMKLAAAALRTSQSALGAYYRRLCARMDKAKAVTAAASAVACVDSSSTFTTPTAPVSFRPRAKFAMLTPFITSSFDSQTRIFSSRPFSRM